MKLVWSEPALTDIESIRDYIRRDSEFYASRFINRIIETVETLVELPARGRLGVTLPPARPQAAG